MAKMKNAKKAFISSLLALTLSGTMMVGTTYAWFTDSVTSGSNVIQSGTLKVGMYWAEGENNPETTAWNNAETGAIFSSTLWEPGKVEARHLKIVNEGSLAFKYKLLIVPNGEVSALADVIDVYFIKGAQNVTRAQLAALTPVGTLADMINDQDGAIHGALLAKDETPTGTYEMAGEATATIAFKMKETAGNEYQGLKIGSDFAIQLLATQYTYEEDSFDNGYDADAEYLLEAKNAKELMQALSANKSVKLSSNVDLAGVAWTPIKSYSGVFDGGGYSISNLTLNSTAMDTGMFASLNGATIRNLNLENVNVTSTNNRTGAIAGQITKDATAPQTVIENVTVSGQVNGGGYYTGGLVGADRSYNTLMVNCVNTADVVGNQQVGGLIGQANRLTVIDGCSNSGDVKATNILAGGIVGFVAGDDKGNNEHLRVTIKNCQNTGAVSQETTDVLYQGLVGGITGAVGRDGGEGVADMLTAYIANCTVLDGQSVYGKKFNYAPSNDSVKVTVSDLEEVSNTNELIAAVRDVHASDYNYDKALDMKTIVLSEGTYAGDINLTVAALGSDPKTNLYFTAAEDETVTLTGTTTLGYFENRVGATAYKASVTFEGITFDHVAEATHSIHVQNVTGLNLVDCTLIGDGEYGISAPGNNPTGVSSIVDCTFVNAGLQLGGNFATGLVIDGCTFNESVINVQGGNGVTVKNCNFTKTVTDANNGESFYVLRTNATPLTIDNCEIAVNSTVNGVGVEGTKGWGVFVNRGAGTWNVTNVKITMSDTAVAQPALVIVRCLTTGKINTTNVTVNNVLFTQN